MIDFVYCTQFTSIYKNHKIYSDYNKWDIRGKEKNNAIETINKKKHPGIEDDHALDQNLNADRGIILAVVFEFIQNETMIISAETKDTTAATPDREVKKNAVMKRQRLNKRNKK